MTDKYTIDDSINQINLLIKMNHGVAKDILLTTREELVKIKNGEYIKKGKNEISNI